MLQVAIGIFVQEIIQHLFEYGVSSSNDVHRFKYYLLQRKRYDVRKLVWFVNYYRRYMGSFSNRKFANSSETVVDTDRVSLF